MLLWASTNLLKIDEPSVWDVDRIHETINQMYNAFNRARSGLDVLNPGKDITFDLVATQFYRFSRV